jgi:hypothetical protein
MLSKDLWSSFEVGLVSAVQNGVSRYGFIVFAHVVHSPIKDAVLQSLLFCIEAKSNSPGSSEIANCGDGLSQCWIGLVVSGKIKQSLAASSSKPKIISIVSCST